jgi:hypothetical protein
MKTEQILEALEQAASQLEVRVRYDALTASGVSSAGGLCKVKGEWWLILDRKATPADRVAMLADALAGFETDSLELPAKAREVIAARRTLKQTAPAGAA